MSDWRTPATTGGGATGQGRVRKRARAGRGATWLESMGRTRENGDTHRAAAEDVHGQAGHRVRVA